jgi:eukaryotic-like serine/threonine-protein kinase
VKAMAREPDNRYPTAAALAADVQRWLDDEPVTAYREPRREQAFRWSRKHKGIVVSSMVSLILLTVVLATTAVFVTRARARARAAEQLAADYAQQAANLKQRAEEKEAQVIRLEEKEETARTEAAEAFREVAMASQAVVDAKGRISHT